MEILKEGNKDIWKYENMEKMEIWKYGKIEKWK